MRPEIAGIIGAIFPPFCKEHLRDVSERVEKTCGKERISGRYHRLPRRIEDDYDILETVIGKGLSGEVMLGKNRHTNTLVAVKSFKMTRRQAFFGEDSDRMRIWTDKLASEVEMALLMDHPRVARLLDVYESERKLKIVTEYLGGGTLLDRVNMQVFQESEAMHAARDMLLALNYMHSQGIVHRDLKPANFVYERKGGNLKLIDFGFSKRFEPDETMERCVGTVGYKAPEVLGRCYTSKCDLWSLGVIIFRLLVGHNPFLGATRDQVNERVKRGIREVKSPDRWELLSEDARDFVDRLLTANPIERLTVTDALQHPWIMARNQMGAALGPTDRHILDGLRRYARASPFLRVCFQLMVWSLSVEERDQVADVFDTMDEDQDGKITLPMFRSAMKACTEVSEGECSEMFDALATNGDGTVSFSQLLASKLSSRPVIGENIVRATYNRVANLSIGHITVKSLRDALGDKFDGMLAHEIFAPLYLGPDLKLSYDNFRTYFLQGHPIELASATKTSLVAYGGC